MLEVRLGPASNPCGTLTLLRDEVPAFDADDEDDLGRVATYFDHAMRNAASVGKGGAGLAGVIEDEAMLLATASGDILFLSDSAGALLDQLASQEQQVFDRRTLPPSCLRLHSRTVGIFLKFVVPMPLRIWRALGSVELSPQHMEVAFWMRIGGGPEAARSRMHVSDAVLRDCVKAVYEKFGCTSEAALLAILRPAISRM